MHESLSRHGLKVLGITAAPTGGSLHLIGPDEPHFWGIFANSPEFADKAPSPMDRWSKRVLDGVAAELDGEALYPFGGAPFHPFFTWALETGRFFSSPINFLVHDTEGLFVSFRGAIVLSDEPPSKPSAPSPCETCKDQPCKTACPVGAFDDGYDVPACKSYLNAPAGADCMAKGCAARRACPIGQGNRLPAQANFHMEAFK